MNLYGVTYKKTGIFVNTAAVTLHLAFRISYCLAALVIHLLYNDEYKLIVILKWRYVAFNDNERSQCNVMHKGLKFNICEKSGNESRTAPNQGM